MKYLLKIEPAIPVKDRHHVEDCLERIGYIIHGGGTYTDRKSCDITFSGHKIGGKDEKEAFAGTKVSR